MRKLGSAFLCLALVVLGIFAHMGYQQFSGNNGGNTSKNRGPGGRAVANQERRAIPVEVATATRADVEERVSESGLLEPQREVTILARVEGQVESVEVEEGDAVELDQALCAIDEEALRIAETLALVEKKHAQAELRRFVDLEENVARVVSEQELQEARLEVERTAAAHEQAQLNRSYSRPQATFAGTVIERFVEVGQHVRAGDALFTIADFNPLLLKVHLPESEVRRIQVGALAQLAGEDNERIANGKVERISPVVSRESLTVEVTTHFADLPPSVRPGSYAKVDIIAQTLEAALLVPRDAVVVNEGGYAVFRIHSSGDSVERIVVETGYEDESVIEIRPTTGDAGKRLEEGDRVVVAGNRNLTDGDRIRIFREQ